MPTPLSSSTLTTISERITVPSYDRSAITAGIVHFGVGGFHRAHQAMYLDRLMSAGLATDWGICGMGVMPSDARMRDVLNSQDNLYTLVLKHADGTREGRVIGSIVDYVYAPDDPAAAIEKLASSAIRIVSLTVTEGGYNIHQVTGEFDSTTPAIVADAQPGVAPTTVFGLVIAALRLRRERGIAPFTIMSCDNIQENGRVAKGAFSSFARLMSPELGDWVEKNVHFPNSMVDRITPVTTGDDLAEVAELFDIADAWPVVCEPFEQWVLEDSFESGRPPYEEAGVQLVDDVEPYELMKLRLLNASHQGMAYFGYLAGYRYAHEAAADPLLATFLRQYMDLEATPTLLPVSGVDLDEYKTTLIKRFSNPEVRDTLARLCAESSDRIPKWLVPVITSQLETGGDVRRSAGIVASWARYAEGTDEAGAPITVVDNLRERVMEAASRQREQPLSFLEDRQLFMDLVDDERFTRPYLATLASLHERGSLATLGLLVTSTLSPAVGKQS